jgi:carboxyl-terminal processing protease
VSRRALVTVAILALSGFGLGAAVLGTPEHPGTPEPQNLGTPEPRNPSWRTTALASFDEVWQTVSDTFYDPTFGGLNWPAVRTELRPLVEQATSPETARQVITRMLARLNRSHFVQLSASAAGDNAPIGDAAVPVEIRPMPAGIVVTHVEPDSSATRAGLTPGMVVLRIDDTPTSAWKSIETGADARMRTFDVWRRAYRLLHGTAGTKAQLRVRTPDGRVRDLMVARESERGEIVTLGNLPPWPVRTDAREVTSPGHRRVGVIGFNVWMPAIDRPIAEAVDRFRSADGLVIDLRGNPGGLALMISGVAGHFMRDADTLLGTMQTRQGPLQFRPNPRLSMPDGRSVSPFAGPVVLLVDGLTASASECFAGALQSVGRVRVIGRRTVGEALPALTKSLPNGDVFMYAIGDFVTASGRSLEGGGVVPDQTVRLTTEALAAGRDLDLEAALRWIDLQKQTNRPPQIDLLPLGTPCCYPPMTATHVIFLLR